MSYKIELADITRDKKEIIDFWKTHFPSWPEGKYQWIYQDNIYGEASCWLARHESDNQLVGSIALFPKKLYVNGKCLNVGLAGDLGVDIEHRGHGLAMALFEEYKKHLHAGNIDLVYGTGNAGSGGASQNVGYTGIGKPIRLVKYIKSCYLLKRKLKIGLLARLLSWPVDIALRLGTPERRVLKGDKYAREIVESFDQRSDTFWSLLNKSDQIIGERTSAFLNWRFNRCLYKKFKTLLLTDSHDNSIRGYIVFRIVDNTFEIVDLLTLDDASYFDSLMAHFIAYAREQKCDNISVVFFNNDRLRIPYERFRFFSFDEPRVQLVYSDESFEYHDYIRNRDNWTFYQADSDV